MCVGDASAQRLAHIGFDDVACGVEVDSAGGEVDEGVEGGMVCEVGAEGALDGGGEFGGMGG